MPTSSNGQDGLNNKMTSGFPLLSIMRLFKIFACCWWLQCICHCQQQSLNLCNKKQQQAKNYKYWYILYMVNKHVEVLQKITNTGGIWLTNMWKFIISRTLSQIATMIYQNKGSKLQNWTCVQSYFTNL